jgi:hypothetical protein
MGIWFGFAFAFAARAWWYSRLRDGGNLIVLLCFAGVGVLVSLGERGAVLKVGGPW